MPTFKNDHFTDKVKVAVIFEPEKIKPVWFQISHEDKREVQEICATWNFMRGASKVITFEVWTGNERFSLEYDTVGMSWRVGRTVE